MSTSPHRRSKVTIETVLLKAHSPLICSGMAPSATNKLVYINVETELEEVCFKYLSLKRCLFRRPTAEQVRHVVSRDAKPAADLFTVSALRGWCRDHEDRLAELLAALLTSCYPQSSPNKRKRGKPSGSPSPETLLTHLDRLRPGCRQLYKLDCMQRALHQAQVSLSKQYCESHVAA